MAQTELRRRNRDRGSGRSRRRRGDLLLNECARRAEVLLGRNITEAGILAATLKGGQQTHQSNYFRIWARDSAWTALWMLRSRKRKFVNAVLASLESLAKGQFDNGSIPNFVDPSGKIAGDAWYLGTVDPTLLWLIVVHEARRLKVVDKDYLQSHVDDAIKWALDQEHPHMRLITQQPAGDWMDSRADREGLVLYSNTLWYAVKRRWRLPNIEVTYESLNTVFWPYEGKVSEDRRVRVLIENGLNTLNPKASNTGRCELGLSYMTLLGSGAEDGDVLANLLAVLTGAVNDARAVAIVNSLLAEGASERYPGKSVLWPIEEKHPRWGPFILRHKQNRKGEYQNGGVWPFIGAFLVLVLVKMNRYEEAREELIKLAQVLKLGNWDFNEHISSATGRRKGMSGQTWNAALFLLAYMAVQQMEEDPFGDLVFERL